MIIVNALAVGCFAFWVWSLVDCINNESSSGNDKIVWILLILFLGIIGTLLYMFIRRPQRLSNVRC